MKPIAMAIIVGALLTGPALAGDAVTDGKAVFNKYCRACHAVIDDDGNALFKGGRIGPNLYNIFGRQAGTEPRFRYSKDMVAAGENGLVWTPGIFDTYIANPRAMIKRTTMAYGGLHRPDAIEALTAYLESVSPDYAPEE